MKIAKYKIFNNLKLVVELFSGELCTEDFINNKINEFNDPDYKLEYLTICDVRDAKVVTDDNIGKKFIDFYRQYYDKTPLRTTVFLTETPLQASYASIYKDLIKNTSEKVKIFSTIDTMIKWINKPEINKNYYNDIINEMKV